MSCFFKTKQAPAKFAEETYNKSLHVEQLDNRGGERRWCASDILVSAREKVDKYKLCKRRPRPSPRTAKREHTCCDRGNKGRGEM